MQMKSVVAAVAAMFGVAAGAQVASAAPLSINKFNHIVVIYQENHSFDNLYGLWGDVHGQPVDGLDRADLAHTLQVRQDNATAYSCLFQLDVNLTSPTPLATTCTDNTGTPFVSAFDNRPFAIDDIITFVDRTCPAPSVFAPNGLLNGTGVPGGCTRDIVHRFYSEQYQIHGGRQDRYVTGSDAAGLAMGYYDSTQLPIYEYLHHQGAPNYVVADHLFQGAFGGSFLNHQWLVAAATPVFANALNDASANDQHSVVDGNGMPTNMPLYVSPLGAQAKDASLTASCKPPAGRPATPKGVACGDYAINTIQPFYWPYSPGTADARRLPPLTNPTIGDRLSAAHVDWAWYSGGWSNAEGDVDAPGWTNGHGPTCSDPNANLTPGFPRCPDKLFQYHHQAFNYFASFAPGTKARAAHLRDEAEFIQSAQNGTLKPVSFVKAVGEDNEHPGYTGVNGGENHLVKLVRAIEEGPNAADTLIIITYDEFGGQWDHVSPPNGQRHSGKSGNAPHDQWGPGTRIPALLIAQKFRGSGVDHTSYDTTSILKLIEGRYGLRPLGPRDTAVTDLKRALEAAE